MTEPVELCVVLCVALFLLLSGLTVYILRLSAEVRSALVDHHGMILVDKLRLDELRKEFQGFSESLKTGSPCLTQHEFLNRLTESFEHVSVYLKDLPARVDSVEAQIAFDHVFTEKVRQDIESQFNQLSGRVDAALSALADHEMALERLEVLHVAEKPGKVKKTVKKGAK